MTATMRGLGKAEPAPGMWAMTAPVPEPGPADALIRVTHAAICGTDIHIANWDEWAQQNVPAPMITGHEFAGEIVALGVDVARPLQVGQRVSGEGHVVDPNSAAARRGRPHLDPCTRGLGVNRQGAFAEYVALPAYNVVPLPDELPNELGALLDPLGNAVHTAQQFALMGEDVLVTGAGPIGIMAAAVARKAGARSVVITDVNPYRLELAARLADVRPVDIAQEDLRDAMAAEGVAGGFDVALEISGAPSAIEQAVDALRMGGGLAMLGLPAKPMRVDWGKVILKALTVKGVYGREMFETWRKMLGLIRGGLDLAPLVTHRFGFDDFQAAFDTMGSGRSGKVVLHW